ncbi:MAG: pyrroline-5-carboxylate reductase [Wolinella sp.]
MQPLQTIVIVGYGKMAKAIATGLNGRFLLEISGRNLEKIHAFIDENRLNAKPLFPLSLESLANKHVILCIKPNAIVDFRDSLSAGFTSMDFVASTKSNTETSHDKPLAMPAALYSIIAGVCIDSLRAIFYGFTQGSTCNHTMHACQSSEETFCNGDSFIQNDKNLLVNSDFLIKPLQEESNLVSCNFNHQNNTQFMPVIRAMPNIAATLHASCTALCGDECARDFAFEIFSMLGATIWLSSEAKLDSATALAGSGPAYLAIISEALMDAGVREGLTRAEAESLTRGLFAGFSSLLSVRHPALIKDEVTSPSGTTIEAIACLESAGIRGLIIEAVHRAKERAIALSKLWS